MMRRARKATAVLRVLTVLAQSLLARAHKSYPSIERVAKSLTTFSSPDEVDELLGNFNVTPAVPVRGFLYTTMLASKGLGPQYPTNHEKKTAATPGQVKNTLNWWNVVSGGLHTCAVRRYFNRSKHSSSDDDFDHLSPDDAPGQLRCWGQNDFGQVHPVPQPFGEPADPDGQMTDERGRTGKKCTGASAEQRAVGTTELNLGLPGKVVLAARRDCWDWDDGWRNLSAGWLHTCGILADGRLICWGNNDHGEMGHLAEPPLLDEGEPKCESEDGIGSKCHARFMGKFALTEFGGVSAGRRQTCAIKCVSSVDAEGNTVYQNQQSDSWTLDNRQGWPEFPPATCTQGRVVCWGDDRLGQGAGGLSKLEAGKVAQYDDFVSVCSGAAHSCAVRAGGSLYCWGHDGNLRTKVPQRLLSMKWRGVRCRGAHTCALSFADQVNRSSLECWGHNGHRQSTVPEFARQVLVPVPDSTVPQIRKEIYSRPVFGFDTGDSHSCALWYTTSDERRCDLEKSKSPAMNGDCWGDNAYSQCNLDKNFRQYGWEDQSNICAAMFYTQISTGSYHSCGITMDDVGRLCQKESTCDEYPPPLCAQKCDLGGLPERSEGSPINVCPRHIRGGLLETPRMAYVSIGDKPDMDQLDSGQPMCVPTRANHLRCWGLDSHGQLFVPGLITSAAPRAVALAIPTMIFSVAFSVALLFH